MDRSLRLQILRAAVRDKAFLKEAWRDLRPDDFTAREESVIVQAAVAFYEKYEQPIGSMLRADLDDIVAKKRFGEEATQKLNSLVRKIQNFEIEPVSVRALIDKVHALKREAFYDEAIGEIIDAHEKNKLSPALLSEFVDRANSELRTTPLITHDYLRGIEKRIERRERWEDNKFPLFMIDPLDARIRGIGRGHLGMWMAPPSGGKGLALVHTAIAGAMQNLKVMHFTLEDPLDVVEDRLDAALTGMPLNKLRKLPNRLRRRFKRARKLMRGRIRIVDGTDSELSVSDMEKYCAESAKMGFDPDLVTIDYDDEIKCEKEFKGESARRHEFSEIYKRLRKFAAKTNRIVWTAAQSTRSAEGRKVITSKDTAEDFSKIRKVFLAISIGVEPDQENVKFLYVMKHRLDRSRFGVDTVADYGSAIFYDRDATMILQRAKKRMKGRGNAK